MRKSGLRTPAVLLALAVLAAAAGCGGGTDKLAVVQTEVASVGVSPASISVQVGQSTTLTAAAYAASGLSVAGAVISWTSSDPSVASVSGSGVVTGVAAGSTTITATSNGRSGQALVTVLPAGGGGGGGGGQSGSVVVNLASQQQVMTGWEATAQAGQGTAAFPLYRDTLFSLAVNDLGINRLRIEVASGIEDTLDYYGLRKSVSESQYLCYRYQTVNDNSDPNSINPAGFHFAELDSTIEEVALPMRQRLAARGERLYLNFEYVSFKKPGCPAFTYIHTNPAEYAEFALAVVQHVQSKYGFAPDSWEMILEPDNNTAWSNGTMIGQALAAAGAKLAAAGFRMAFVAPSAADIGVAITYFDAIQATPGTAGLLAELSYHRYRNAPTASTLAAVAQRTTQYGIRSAMLEHIGSDYNDLIADLTQARVSAWQQYTLAFTGPDDGSKYYVVNAANPAAPTVTLSSRGRYLRQFFRYVRLYAVRVDATATAAAAGVTPVAFVNADGKAVVVLAATGAASVTVQGLPAGTYGIRYTTASANDVAANDQTITAGQLVSASIPAAGVLTIFAR